MKKLIPAMLLAGVLLGGSAYWWYTRPYDSIRLLQCLPQERSLHVFIDVGVLRSAGILDMIAGSKTAEDSDYKKFIEETGFDYRTDLDSVAAGFHDGEESFAVQGRFHWDRLSQYATSHGGRCQDALCSMPASQPGRTISFYPLRTGVLALAVSHDPRAADTIAPGAWKNPPQIPRAAVWISTPPFIFANPDSLPTGTRSFLSPLAQARGTTFTLGPGSSSPGSSAKAFDLRMIVDCNTPDDAASLATQLSKATDLLKKMLDRDKMTPNPADLSGVLVAGRFESQQSVVTGLWTIDRSFVDSLMGGKIQ
jgi:hypothetical protein